MSFLSIWVEDLLNVGNKGLEKDLSNKMISLIKEMTIDVKST